MFQDKMAEDADWKDGINIFRSRVVEQLDGILEVLDILERELTKLKNKENTP